MVFIQFQSRKSDYFIISFYHRFQHLTPTNEQNEQTKLILQVLQFNMNITDFFKYYKNLDIVIKKQLMKF